MYIRTKTIRRGDKEYSYYQLVEGRRENGQVRQRVVGHLGNLPSREHADYVARGRGLLCSALGCSGRGVVEDRNHEGARARFCEEHDSAIRNGETVRFYPLF